MLLLMLRVLKKEGGELEPAKAHAASGAMLISALFYGPLFIASLSFMTDAPFLLLWSASCLAWSAWRAAPSWMTALIAIGISGMAMAQRQFGVLVPVGLHAWMLMEFGRRHRWKDLVACLAPLLGLLVLFVLLSAWWRKVSPDVTAPFDLTLSPVFILGTAFETLGHLGMAGIPLLFLPLSAEARAVWSRPAFRLVLAVFFVYGIGHHLRAGRLFPYGDNQLSVFGVFGLDTVLLGAREPIFGTGLRLLLTALSVGGAVRLLLGFVAGWHRLGLSPLRQVLMTSGLLYFALTCCRRTFFDRYTIPLLPCAWVALIDSAVSFGLPSWRRVLPWVASIGVAVLSISLVHDYFRWNEARWAAGQVAIAMGYASGQISGGYEFNGHFNGTVGVARGRPEQHPIALSFSDLPGTERIAEFPYRTFWGSGGGSIKLLRSNP